MKLKSIQKSPPIPTAGIVCGTDFSPPADDAALIASGIARRLEAPLALVHAVDMPGPAASDKEATAWVVDSRKKSLTKKARQVRKDGVEVFPHLETGRPDEILVKLAATAKARLIVIGSLGRRDPDRWLLGSVAERTAERAETPTLVLRASDRLREWLNGKRTLKVFVCFNFSATSEIALRWVRELMALGRCDVVLGYVNWPIEEHMRIGAAGPLPFGENPPDVLAVLERDMKERARALLGGPPVRCRVEAHLGSLEVRLSEIAKEEGADLIVAGSHQYRGLGRLWHSSVSRGLLSRASMSVAIVPRTSDPGGESKLMPAIRHVLLCTDFSEQANAAIPHGYSLLRGGGILTLLHVAAPSPKSPSKSAVSDAVMREVSKKLRALIPAEAAEHGILTQIEVVVDREPARVICQTAERLGVDAICLCSHGRSGVSKALLGSVAGAVMAKSRRPLFVVRPSQ